ncbi:MAG: RnfABCDGE type electron transport complex subunit D, partial [Thermoplasmata archaeon]
WWVGIGPYGEYLLIGLGLVLLARSPRSWRLSATFLASYVFLSVVQHVVLGAATDPSLLLLEAFDPATLFFALFMVTEPRTSPADSGGQVLVAGTVGIVAALSPLVFPSLGILLGLLTGNAVAVVLRRGRATPRAVPTPARPRSIPRAHGPPARTSPRWPLSERVTVGILVIVLLGAIAGSAPSPLGGAPLVHLGGGGGGGPGATNCAADNPSIPASTASSLHHLLGPSVLLSYDGTSGVVVFYDPVNHVTVTETDLYEDYGVAEFNGDDYAVSGCSP